jgi:predicted transcriptional regulator
MNNRPLHKVRASILKSLRRTGPARFSALMKPTGLESDTFKFHLRHLVKLGYVTKLPPGEYELTPSGKELANTIDDANLVIQKQPKLSFLLVVARTSRNERQFLLQKRLRSPYFGYRSFITGPILWAESFEEAAGRELKKQAGLSAQFKVRTFCRKRDYLSGEGNLLEDKLFVVLEASDVHGQLTDEWSGGENAWMTLEALRNQPKTFSSDLEVVESMDRNDSYISLDAEYDPEDY